MELGASSGIVELPNGTYPARLDDKGRLKLPAAFHRYLESLPEKKLFVTSLNLRTARIYPIAVWRENKNLLEGQKEKTRIAREVLLVANHLGADTEMDAQGRVLIHPELRRKLNIENAPVNLVPAGSRIDVYSVPAYEQELQQAFEGIESKVLELEEAGLK